VTLTLRFLRFKTEDECILGENKHDFESNKEKRRVIKHHVEETKYSLTESILRFEVIEDLDD